MIRIACATDDGENFSKKHFGAAKYFIIFEINSRNSSSENRFKKYKKVENIPFKEKIEGDPEKAKHISNILDKYNVKVIINKSIGPNIIKMRKKYVPIISNIENIKSALVKIDIQSIEKEINNKTKEDKEIFYIR